MDPVTTFLIAPLAKKATDAVLGAAGRRLRRIFKDPERQTALERATEAGILAMVRTARVDEDSRVHLLDVLRRFFTHEDVAEDVGRALVPLLRGDRLDPHELEELLAEAGYDPTHLSGFEPTTAFTAFEGGFSAAVLQQGVLREELKTHLLLAQLELHREMRDALQEMVRFLAGAKPGTAGVSAGQITAESVAGTQIVLAAPALALPASTPGDWEPFYLRYLIGRCDSLDLTPIDETGPRPDEASAVRLSDVFTTLLLEGLHRRETEEVTDFFGRRRERRPGDEPEEMRRETEEETKPVSAVEGCAAVARLVVLGRPGGGKSTLVNHLVTELARRRLGSTDGGKLPGWPEDDGPLPVRVLLRRFASWLPDGARPEAGLVWQYLQEQLRKAGCGDDAYAGLRDILATGGVVFFDGLDEVAEDDATRKRSLLCRAVESFAREVGKRCRVVVTCREYAYRKSDAWRLDDAVFTEVSLAPFAGEQIEAFTHTWYRVVGPGKGWDEARCQQEAEHLARAAEEWPHLRELAESPLLLTLMAQIHGRDGYLPRDRADLYERTVNLLLAHWENRLVRDLRGAGGTGADHDRMLQLDLRIEVVRNALERVAFEAHERQEKESGRSEAAADIPGDDLLHALGDQLGSLDRAQQVIVYVEQRAGLLHAVGERTYRFPHRTFQEYLAARHLLKQGEYDTMLTERVRRDLAWWREVFLLAAGASRETPRVISDLVDELVPRPPDEGKEVEPGVAEEARLAAQALEETRFTERASKEEGRFAATFEKIQEWLRAGMKSTETLEPTVRARCGLSLAGLGDPRSGVTSVEEMEVCRVPAAAFWMGSEKYESEKPQHLNEHLDYDYWLARYPVTVAQFRQYVEASGVKPEDPRSLRGPLNAPVARVDWHEATGFCCWLTDWLGLPKGYKAQLPSEAEWEKAARGGVEIPQEPCVRQIPYLAEPSVSLVPNPEPKREYPWPGDFDKGRCNSGHSGVDTVSAVGCFANGRSVYGCEEMSGNVWEWTRSAYEASSKVFSYPYDPNDGREKPHKSPLWVVRGGSFVDRDDGVRCACRGRCGPGGRNVDVGFRVVLSPSKL